MTKYLGNPPCFEAYDASSQVFATSTWTKQALSSESYDLTNEFDSVTNYRFQPAVAGYYQVNARVSLQGAALNYGTSSIYKNGVSFRLGSAFLAAAGFATTCELTVNALIQLNGTTDYLEYWAYGQTTGNITASTAIFSGFLVRTP